ncbi:MAG: riboflavin synthase [Candidatus Krumholzibacteriota bacterium]|nr:riboflavin synthase [Candidatus Krumholzibacteriota bacterium]
MFTGLVETTGTVVSMLRRGKGARLTVRTSLDNIAAGESIAVNGVCGTAVEPRGGLFSCDVLAETLRATNLGSLRPGLLVNIERALRVGDRLGGHIVNGHVDGTGTVEQIARDPRSIRIRVDDGLFRYIVAKGSVAVNGVSLTVGPDPRGGRFDVFIIPHTWDSTNLHALDAGRRVNIEVDIVAKYVERFLGDRG